MKREQLIAYSMNFTSFIIQENYMNKIDRIILFGSVARDNFDKDSDIDIFIDTSYDIEKDIKKCLSLFLKSEAQRKWELKGLKHEISLKVGKLNEWDLKRSIISDGIILYGKFKEIPDKIKQYALLELSFNRFKRGKKVSLWRKLYGYKQKTTRKEYETRGIINEIGAIRMEKGLIVPTEKLNLIEDFLDKEKINYKIREIWSDNI